MESLSRDVVITPPDSGKVRHEYISTNASSLIASFVFETCTLVMKTGHKGIRTDLQCKDLTATPDDTIGFFDDYASEYSEDSSPCCGPGSGGYLLF